MAAEVGCDAWETAKRPVQLLRSLVGLVLSENLFPQGLFRSVATSTKGYCKDLEQLQSTGRTSTLRFESATEFLSY